MSIYQNYIKPLIDRMVSLILILVLSPIILIIFMVLWIAQGNGLFRQERIGKNNQKFVIYKFKTMNDKKNHRGQLLPDEDRLTGIGSFVRRTSLDELPQLFNIIKGDMSFIGPRPLLVEYLPFYSSEQIKRHSVTPGITGWAQVNGRNSISWDEKFDLDLYYINHQSLALDLKIFFLSFIKILKSEGIEAEGHATMPKFSDYVKEKEE